MASNLEHKILICVDCEEEFIFTAGAQEYFAEKGYTEDPKRCKHCYMIHKRGRDSGEGARASGPMLASESIGGNGKRPNANAS